MTNMRTSNSHLLIITLGAQCVLSCADSQAVDEPASGSLSEKEVRKLGLEGDSAKVASILGASFASQGPAEGPSDNDGRIGAMTPAQNAGAKFYPQGLTCGMSYKRGEVKVVDDYCGAAGNRTLAGLMWGGFSLVFTGDFGLGAGSGLYHQNLNHSTPGSPSSDAYRLPQGTTCGFKHTINAPHVTCLGFDAAQKCPDGWTKRSAVDAKAPDGMWAWCEYQDRNSLCTNKACVDDVPSGTVCGVTHTQELGGTGQCNGVLTTVKCPGGWVERGNFDWGRQAKQGIGWCMRP